MNGGRRGIDREVFARRVLEEVSLKERQREDAQDEHDILNALAEFTSLTEAELESIATKVKGFPGEDGDNFFSVKEQVVVLSAMLGALHCLLWMI